MRKFPLTLMAFGVHAGLAASSYIDSLSDNAKELFTESMDWMDTYYDSKAGYLYDFSAAAALRHETRSSAWYAFGLLARNKGHDVSEAEKIIQGIINGQHKDPSDEWYGTYQIFPEEPSVGSTTYPADIYNTWDPNWRGFVGTTFIMALEEFPKLISKPTQKLMLESLHNATRGDEYRFGNLDPKKDNLYPSYSNPAIMRAFMSGWTGRRLKESNMTRSGERYAKDIIDLFNRANTLSEFNSGTYTGVSLYGLTLWSKYLPKDSIMAKHGPDMIKHTWEAVGNLWHPGMRNMAGPWDRSYGYDMNRYLSLMALWYWAFIGKEKSSLIQKPQIMSHMADYAWAPLFAVLAKSHQKLIPKQVLGDLVTFKGEHNFTGSTFYPPFDTVPRNISTWLSKDLTIGAQSFRQISLGGPGQSQEAYNPAVVQWDTGKEISFISLYPSETALDVEVGPGKPTIEGWDDLPNLRVNISGNIDPNFQLSFGGAFGGSSQTLRDFELWNFTYTMPKSSQGVPALVMDLETLL
ncbi:hypothetical protein FLAG1_05854 [Fusarium langsethiae]|uniref:Uncharacterized protein n=1 Tax=Fusarium langsethiae TaxID=179993 RepID=A0A0N0V6T2_FUSLA|nr:hypothetical protein FLAG1_05854 [Fusarium langsethiae]GKU04954.1 unnamed protein product [Fusarium langsethiae]GKU20157.1 unnamed protein product [Fusarium langsethiae]